MPVHDRSRSDQDERFGPPGPERSQHNHRTACAGQSVDGEVVARAEPAIADGEPGFQGRVLRELKALTIHPRRCRSDTIMARILSELSEFSFSPSHSFCRCTTLRPVFREVNENVWPGTPVASSSVCSSCAICCAVRGSRAGTRDFETVPICATLKETEHDSVPQPYQNARIRKSPWPKTAASVPEAGS